MDCEQINLVLWLQSFLSMAPTGHPSTAEPHLRVLASPVPVSTSIINSASADSSANTKALPRM